MRADTEAALVEELLPAPPPMSPSVAVFLPPLVDYAGWWRRVGATIIDYLIVAVGAVVVSMFFAATQSAAIAFIGLLVVFVGVAAYFIVPNTNGGATVGKSVLGVKIQLEDGGDLGLGVSTLRFLGSALSWTWILGILWPLWDDKKQSFHDKIALTVVVKR